MIKQTREPDLALFVKLSRIEPPKSIDQVPMKVLIPAFVTSELRTAFQIGFALFLPFIVIDVVVASVLEVGPERSLPAERTSIMWAGFRAPGRKNRSGCFGPTNEGWRLKRWPVGPAR